MIVLLGLPPGPNTDIDQPPPVIHSTSGFAAAYSPIAARYPARSSMLLRSQREASMPAPIGWTWLSWKAGNIMRPPRSTSVVFAPTIPSAAAAEPTKLMRPSVTATASAQLRDASTV